MMRAYVNTTCNSKAHLAIEPYKASYNFGAEVFSHRITGLCTLRDLCFRFLKLIGNNFNMNTNVQAKQLVPPIHTNNLFTRVISTLTN